MIREVIQIETTQDGVPCFKRDRSQWVAVHLNNADSDDDVTHIEIVGHAASLRRLGEILIGVANCSSYHEHLDASEISPLLIRSDRVELTISNIDDAPPSQSDSAKIMPDWARD